MRLTCPPDTNPQCCSNLKLKTQKTGMKPQAGYMSQPPPTPSNPLNIHEVSLLIYTHRKWDIKYL